MATWSTVQSSSAQPYVVNGEMLGGLLIKSDGRFTSLPSKASGATNLDSGSLDSTFFEAASGSVIQALNALAKDADAESYALTNLSDFTAAHETNKLKLISDDGTSFTLVESSGDITFDQTGAAAIVAGVVVNADINASAAIAVSKLAASTIGLGETTVTLGTTATEVEGFTTLGATDLSGTVLFLNETAVTSTAAELNIMDGGTASSTVTVGDTDRLVLNDGGTMKQVSMDQFETYFESGLDTLNAVTSATALAAVGTITSGVWQGTEVAVAKGGTGATSASGARTALGVAIGSDVQDYDAGLANLAGVTMGANKMYYTSGDNVHVAADLTAAGRALLDDATAAAQLVTLGINASATELNYNDITTLGTAQASKVVTVSSSDKITLGAIEIEGSVFDIDGGAIDATTIGGTTPAAGTFTTLTTTGNVVLGNASADTITVTGTATFGSSKTSTLQIAGENADGDGVDYLISVVSGILKITEA